jgi:hypothetical protein
MPMFIAKIINVETNEEVLVERDQNLVQHCCCIILNVRRDALNFAADSLGLEVVPVKPARRRKRA